MFIYSKRIHDAGPCGVNSVQKLFSDCAFFFENNVIIRGQNNLGIRQKLYKISISRSEHQIETFSRLKVSAANHPTYSPQYFIWLHYNKKQNESKWKSNKSLFTSKKKNIWGIYTIVKPPGLLYNYAQFRICPIAVTL